MIIPVEINVQIVNKLGQPYELANVLFRMRIYKNADSWHNYSVIKTNAGGRIHLSKDQIIENINQASNDYEGFPTPTRFQLSVWSSRETTDFVNITKKIIDIYNNEDFIRQDLTSRGISEEAILDALPDIRKKAKKDIILLEEVKDAINGHIIAYTPVVKGVWQDELPRQYQFAIELKQ